MKLQTRLSVECVYTVCTRFRTNNKHATATSVPIAETMHPQPPLMKTGFSREPWNSADFFDGDFLAYSFLPTEKTVPHFDVTTAAEPAIEVEAIVRSPTKMAAAKIAAVDFNKIESNDVTRPACLLLAMFVGEDLLANRRLQTFLLF